MADIYNSQAEMRSKLISGKSVVCPNCKKGVLKPYPDSISTKKATYFECTNEKCDFFIRYDLAIDIE